MGLDRESEGKNGYINKVKHMVKMLNICSCRTTHLRHKSYTIFVYFVVVFYER